MANCRGCGASIVWSRTAKNNRPMPLDLPSEMRAVQVGNSPPPSSEPIVEIRTTYMPHHATCPNVGDFRKKDNG